MELVLVNPREKNPRRRRRRRVNARKRRVGARRRRRNPIAAYMANPRRRRRRAARRRNPRVLGMNLGGITSNLIPAATGGLGALALDVGMSYVPLPDALKIGPARILTRVAGAFGIGLLTGFVTSKRTAQLATMGALTVVAYQTIRELVAQYAPQIPIADYTPTLGYSDPAPRLGAYMNPGMGAYMQPQGDVIAPAGDYSDGM